MRILITGASGFIGSHLGKAVSSEHDVLGLICRSRAPLSFPHQAADLTQDRPIADILREFRPEVVVHAAAHSRVLASEQDPQGAHEINVKATGRLARWAGRLQARLIFLSSDQVFSGRKGVYIESDTPDPINHYGRTKLEAEKLVLTASSGNLVVRSNTVVGPTHGRGQSFSEWILDHLQRGEKIALYYDQFRSPIHIRTMVRLLEFACLNPLSGILHAGGPQRISRADMGFALSRCYGLSADPIEVTSVATHPHAQIMTRDTSYNILRLRQMIPLLKLRSLEEEFAEEVRQAEVKA